MPQWLGWILGSWICTFVEKAGYPAKENAVCIYSSTDKDKQILEMEENGLTNRPGLPCPQGKPVPGEY